MSNNKKALPPIKSEEQIKRETSAMAALLRIVDPKRGLTREEQLKEIAELNRRQREMYEAEKKQT